MAVNLKISGNFLVLFDTIARKDIFHHPRSSVRYLFEEDGSDNFFTFFQANYAPGKVSTGSLHIDFTDIIDNRTGSAFTDTDELQEFLDVNLGGVNQPIFAYKSTFCDYSKTASGTLPTTLTKLDFSGATLVDETQDLFDPANSRIENFNENEVGMASVSMTVDSSAGGTLWVELQLKGYDSSDTLLFSKRGTTVSLNKGVTADAVNKNLEFYFGADVAYFEVWYRGSSALDFDDPAITVIKF